MPLTTKRRGRGARTPAATEAEIIRLYTSTDTPLADIAGPFNISPKTIYDVLGRHHIDWRRDYAMPFATWQAQENRLDAVTAESETIPQAQIDGWIAQLQPGLHEGEITLENAARAHEATSLAWTVEIADRLTVYGDTIDAALAAAHLLRPSAHITAIQEQRP